MITAHEYLEGLQAKGAAQFDHTGLAAGHGALTRTVRRQRAVRATTTSVVAVGAAGALAFATVQFVQPSTGISPGTSTPPATASGTPTAAPTIMATVSVTKQERIENVAADLLAAVGTPQDDAMAALINAVPPEANGNPEGWVVAGDYTFDEGTNLQAAAVQMVAVMVDYLESAGVPREDWLDTVILASIVQQEAPAGHADQAGVARVLLNRIAEDMPLQIESPLAYYLHADTELVGDDGWAVDTPFNTYMYTGLPPSAIGVPTHEALEAAVSPLDGDWMFFLRKPDGNILLFTTYEEFAVAVDEYFPGTGASD